MTDSGGARSPPDDPIPQPRSRRSMSLSDCPYVMRASSMRNLRHVVSTLQPGATLSDSPRNSSHQQQDEGGTGALAQPYFDPMEMRREATRRVASLEYELADSKRRLAEVTRANGELREQKEELRNLVDEITKNHHRFAEDQASVLTDRAKRTMMLIRLERNEWIKQRLVTVVRERSLEALHAVRGLHVDVQTLKADFVDQLTRFSSLMETTASTLDSFIVDRLEKSARQNEGTYLEMVAAAVQQQQRSIVLSSDHPVVDRLRRMFDKIDYFCERMGRNWAFTECYSGGVPPKVDPPRRFMDPIVNIASYTSIIQKIASHVDHTTIVNLLFSQLSLPQLQYVSANLLREVDSKFQQKLIMLFEFIKTFRFPVGARTNSLGVAFRMLSAAEITQKETEEIAVLYAKISHEHVARLFRHISAMLRLTKKFATAVEGGSARHEERPARDMSCPTCAIPMHCEDCRKIQIAPANAYSLIEQRRSLIQDFTDTRCKHFVALSGIVDKLFHALRHARVISVAQLQAAMGRQQPPASPQSKAKPTQSPFIAGDEQSSAFYFTKLRAKLKEAPATGGSKSPQANAPLSARPVTAAEQKTFLNDLEFLENMTKRKSGSPERAGQGGFGTTRNTSSRERVVTSPVKATVFEPRLPDSRQGSPSTRVRQLQQQTTATTAAAQPQLKPLQNGL